MSSSREAIGERIRKIRGGQTQRDFAGMLGFSHGYLGDIERGRSYPSVEFLASLAVKCGIDLTWLITGKHWGAAGASSGVVILSPSDDDEAEFAAALDFLWNFYVESDEEIQAWMRVQLRRAFPELASELGDTKKQQSAAAEGA